MSTRQLGVWVEIETYCAGCSWESRHGYVRDTRTHPAKNPPHHFDSYVSSVTLCVGARRWELRTRRVEREPVLLVPIPREFWRVDK